MANRNKIGAKPECKFCYGRGVKQMVDAKGNRNQTKCHCTHIRCIDKSSSLLKK